jgi:hypothetical protein
MSSISSFFVDHHRGDGSSLSGLGGMNRIICGGDQIIPDERNEALVTAKDPLLVIEVTDDLRVMNEMTSRPSRNPTRPTR